MPDVKDLTIDELEYLIEQKILEVLGDPHSGLELKPELNRSSEGARKIPRGEFRIMR